MIKLHYKTALCYKISVSNGITITRLSTVATLYHGVNIVDEECIPDWNSPKGRWFLGLYSNDSDMVEKRHTVYGVSVQLKDETATGEVPVPVFL